MLKSLKRRAVYWYTSTHCSSVVRQAIVSQLYARFHTYAHTNTLLHCCCCCQGSSVFSVPLSPQILRSKSTWPLQTYAGGLHDSGSFTRLQIFNQIWVGALCRPVSVWRGDVFLGLQPGSTLCRTVFFLFSFRSFIYLFNWFTMISYREKKDSQ